MSCHGSPDAPAGAAGKRGCTATWRRWRTACYRLPKGNGICHQGAPERFSKPGKTFDRQSDSRTVTCGSINGGTFGWGTGLWPWAASPRTLPIRASPANPVKAEAVGLKRRGPEVLRRITTKGAVGPLSSTAATPLPHSEVSRAVIANMGAEAGITTSIFPSDGKPLEFEPGRERICPTRIGGFTTELTICLMIWEPNVAVPHSPTWCKVKEIQDLGSTRC